jgi:threonine/homoserine/homoserine lactone efflux protein
METLLPLVSYAFVTSITPGPNNLMLAASGIGFGLRRTVPLMLGVSAGFVLLLLTCGLGIGSVLQQWPGAMPLLKAAGSAYLIVLAWKLRGSLRPTPAGTTSKPGSFLTGLAFQFVNPKAWMMSITAAAVFLPGLGSGWQAVAVLCLVASLVNLPCISTWAVLGSTIRAQLHEARWQRRFSTVIIALTLYAATAIWL